MEAPALSCKTRAAKRCGGKNPASQSLSSNRAIGSQLEQV